MAEFAALPDSLGLEMSEGRSPTCEQACCDAIKQTQPRNEMQLSRKLPAADPLNLRVGYSLSQTRLNCKWPPCLMR